MKYVVQYIILKVIIQPAKFRHFYNITGSFFPSKESFSCHLRKNTKEALHNEASPVFCVWVVSLL